MANDDLHRQLREIGMPSEYRVRNGAHTSEYWRTAMLEVLRFIECRFNGRAFLPQPRRLEDLTPHPNKPARWPAFPPSTCSTTEAWR